MAVPVATAGFKPLAIARPPRTVARRSPPARMPVTHTPLLRATSGKSDHEADASVPSLSGMPFAAALAAAMVFGAAVPEEALAARSGGRVGGSSFSSRRAAPPPRAAPRVNSRSTNVYVAPPVYGGSPFGFSPFGFSPFGYGYPVVGMGFGGIFNLFILMFVLTTVLNVVSSMASKKKDDDWKDDDYP